MVLVGSRVSRKFLTTFSLRSFNLKVKSAVCGAKRRLYSTSSDNVLVSKDEKTGIATVRMNNPPVNSLNGSLLVKLRTCFEELDKDTNCRAVILTSEKPNVFCAGLDIMEFYQKSPDHVSRFMEKLHDGWHQLYSSRLVTIAAINGHAPGGGCALALACDYRVMAEGNFTIGLNEIQLNLVIPFFLRQTMMTTIGNRQTDMAVMLGTMYPSDKALQLGLVDKLAPMEEIQTVAEEETKKWLQIPDQARVITKMSSRKPLLDEIKRRQQEDIKTATEQMTRESVQEIIKHYLKRLKQKHSKMA